MHFPSSTSSSSLITAIFCLLLVIASLFLPGAYGRASAISTHSKVEMKGGFIPAKGSHPRPAGVYAAANSHRNTASCSRKGKVCAAPRNYRPGTSIYNRGHP
ncbi:uncharacterized protein LOC120286631 [Eucalyptus grandis]|uniref:uncharacterized protein LOC120286631 n=1 Tax=Eucalyptus grandis TaxID=71139 RepID=UPI00192F03AB|nr:uncharacterized protein LOC120286631 [Eucalyptus grandis]